MNRYRVFWDTPEGVLALGSAVTGFGAGLEIASFVVLAFSFEWGLAVFVAGALVSYVGAWKINPRSLRLLQELHP